MTGSDVQRCLTSLYHDMDPKPSVVSRFQCFLILWCAWLKIEELDESYVLIYYLCPVKLAQIQWNVKLYRIPCLVKFVSLSQRLSLTSQGHSGERSWYKMTLHDHSYLSICVMVCLRAIIFRLQLLENPMAFVWTLMVIAGHSTWCKMRDLLGILICPQ